MKKVLDADCMRTEEAAHRYMKEKLQFPDYYGENLDALYDCLSEYDGLEIGLSNCGGATDHLDKICRVMEAAGVQVKKYKSSVDLDLEREGTMKVEICIGSSCHLRGSEAVVKVFKGLLKEAPQRADVELCGSFCMGACSKGVSIRIRDNIYHVKPEDAEDFFKEVILKEAAKCE